MNRRIVYAHVQANKSLTCMVKQSVLAEITALQLQNTSSTFTVN